MTVTWSRKHLHYWDSLYNLSRCLFELTVIWIKHFSCIHAYCGYTKEMSCTKLILLLDAFQIKFDFTLGAFQTNIDFFQWILPERDISYICRAEQKVVHVDTFGSFWFIHSWNTWPSRNGLDSWNKKIYHDDLIKWKHFPHYWPFGWGIHWSLVNSPHTGQWRWTLMFSVIWAWTNGWVNNWNGCDLRRHHDHYDLTVMSIQY